MRIVIEGGGVLAERGPNDRRNPKQEWAGDAVLLWASRRNLVRGIAHHFGRSVEYCEGRVLRLSLIKRKARAPVDRIADLLEAGCVTVTDGRIFCDTDPRAGRPLPAAVRVRPPRAAAA